MTQSEIVTRRERLSQIALERGGLVTFVTLVLYVVFAPRTIVDGDNAEFSTLAAIGGTAHPSGYPLYLLYLHATQWLPSASPAHAAGIATAILGAAAVGVLFQACRAWGGTVVSATLAVALFAGAPVIIRISTEAEVFALNNLAVASVLWLAAANGPLRGMRRAAVLALVAGLGLSNHMTCALVAPIGLLGVARGIRESERRALAVTAAFAAFVVGLTPYLYLFITPDTPLSWGKVHDVDGLIGTIMRRDYGGPGAFMPVGAPTTVSAQLIALASTLGRTWLWAGLAVGLVGGIWHIARPGDSTEPRWGWCAWLVSWLLAGPLLVAKFNIAPSALGLYVVQRFHVMPALLVAVPLAVALRGVGPALRKTSLGERRAAALVGTIGAIAIASTSLGHLSRVHTPAVEQYARNMLHALPQNSVVFIGQDDEYFAVGYVQWALGERQDVVAVAPLLTDMPWYAQRVAARGVVIPPGDGLPIIRTIEHLLATGHPVFVEKSRSEVIQNLPTYPYGTWMRVLPRGTAVPPIDAVIAENQAIYAKFELSYPRPGPDDEFATAIHYRYAGTWKTLAKKAEQAGNRDLAQLAAEMARDIGPTP